MNYEELYLQLYDRVISAFEHFLPPEGAADPHARYLRLQTALSVVIRELQEAGRLAREQEAAPEHEEPLPGGLTPPPAPR